MQKPHYLEHRKRLRERFRNAGFGGLRDYEALELMLSFCIPRRDVKPLAKDLIKKMGGFREVLDAPYEELIKVSGMGEASATFLHALRGCSALYLKGGLKRRKISSTLDLLDYCRAAMSGLRDEQFRVVFLDSQNGLIADEVIQDGTVNEAVVYPRKVMERAIHHKASAMVLVHNHPGGNCKPSAQDKALTGQIARIAREFGIALHDHMIICGSGYFSFLEKRML